MGVILWFCEEFMDLDVTIHFLLSEKENKVLNIHLSDANIDTSITYDWKKYKYRDERHSYLEGSTNDKLWSRRKVNHLERKYSHKDEDTYTFWNNFRVVSLADLSRHFFTFEEAKYLIDEWTSTYTHGRRPLI